MRLVTTALVLMAGITQMQGDSCIEGCDLRVIESIQIDRARPGWSGIDPGTLRSALESTLGHCIVVTEHPPYLGEPPSAEVEHHGQRLVLMFSQTGDDYSRRTLPTLLGVGKELWS